MFNEDVNEVAYVDTGEGDREMLGVDGPEDPAENKLVVSVRIVEVASNEENDFADRDEEEGCVSEIGLGDRMGLAVRGRIFPEPPRPDDCNKKMCI